MPVPMSTNTPLSGRCLKKGIVAFQSGPNRSADKSILIDGQRRRIVLRLRRCDRALQLSPRRFTMPPL